MNLADIDLTDINLTDVTMTWANLARANLTAANLTRADLTHADLIGATLVGADLTDADLTDADLTNAKLTGANLTRTNLTGVDLTGVDLTGADLTGADLTRVRDDLCDVLDNAVHEVPALLAALREGKIDGKCYEGTCACLVGTIAKVRGCHYNNLVGITPDTTRAVERWFMGIRPGDTPERSQIAAITVTWIEEWSHSLRPVNRLRQSRQRIS